MELKAIFICIVAVSCNLEVASATSELEYRVITLNQTTTANCTLYTSENTGNHGRFTDADIRMLNCGRKCNHFLKTCVYHSQQDGICTICMTESVENDPDAKDLTPADFTLAATAVIYEKLDPDDCSPNPCVNGSCEDKFDDYDCHCNEGYRGKNCNDDGRYSCWQAGSSATLHVSAGALGVWSTAVTTFSIHRWQTNSWTIIEGGFYMLSVGSAVCGLGGVDMYCRDGITDETPLGTAWTHIPRLDTSLDMVDVSNEGHIWGLNLNLFHRLGTNDSVYGTDWSMVETPAEDLSQLTVGAAGVWGVASSGNIYYRVGTYGDNGSSGSTWQLVDGSAIYIDSGDNYVWICNAANEVFRRAISSNNPSGAIWERVYGPVFKQISAQSDSIVWGVNTDNTVSSCIESITCAVSFGPYGGGGGVYFDDGNLAAEGDITQIYINVDLCIRLTYGVRDGPCHGGSRGASHTIILTQGEYITAVSLRLTTNGPIKQMQFKTNSRDLGWYGSSVGNLAGDDIINIDSNGRKLVYISGRSGDTINTIIFHFYCV